MRVLKGRAGLSAGIITVLVPVVLAGPVFSLGVAFANQFADLVTHLQKQPLRIDANLLTQLERYPLVGSLAEWLRQKLTATNEQLQGWLVSSAQMLLQSLASTGGRLRAQRFGHDRPLLHDAIPAVLPAARRPSAA